MDSITVTNRIIDIIKNDENGSYELLSTILPQMLENLTEDELTDMCIDLHLLTHNDKIYYDGVKPFMLMKLINGYLVYGKKFKYDIFAAYFGQSPEIMKEIEGITYDTVVDPDDPGFLKIKELLKKTTQDLNALFLADYTKIN